MSNLYHVSIYMPEHLRVNASCRVFTSLIWSRHAREAILNDRYGALPASAIPLELNAAEWQIVEAEVDAAHSTILKAVYRRQVDGARSLVMVICPDAPGVGFVKTVWINLAGDKHKTLDKSKYCTS